MTYGCETWSLSNTQLEKLVTTQRKMERIMVGVHPQGQKECEVDPGTERCDRHYQEHMRKQIQMGGSHDKEKQQQMNNQIHRMDIPWTKDLEADQERDGATT